MSVAPNPVHERALRLSYDDWLSVVAFTLACVARGDPCPPWAWALYRYADATARAVPRALIDALGRGSFEGRTAECDRDLATLGEAQGLCFVLERVGPKVWIIPTPFGVAVRFAHDLRELEALPPGMDHEGKGAEA
ncbi:hypothetical protein [Paraliomyxa miuraensis]|uniref:hypothetical protein n=1 Tax=Paraliomyxa miuraensis TaxID=376150 RepID=UPI0022569647|nr:hypothetical protein [Paraliomyxa miuraensis]MCX4239606.1 hypothetical protein [Paraliomyxa miuraensis]